MPDYNEFLENTKCPYCGEEQEFSFQAYLGAGDMNVFSIGDEIVSGQSHEEGQEPDGGVDVPPPHFWGYGLDNCCHCSKEVWAKIFIAKNIFDHLHIVAEPEDPEAFGFWGPDLMSCDYLPENLPDLLSRERWRQIPPGHFMMGGQTLANLSEPVHKVTIKPGFWMATFPIINGEFQRFIEDGGYRTDHFWSPAGLKWRNECHIIGPRKYDGFDGPFQPVVGVSWFEGEAFTKWLTHKMAAVSWAKGLEASLPTEAQWEYAARGKNSYVYPWGNEKQGIDFANVGLRIGKTTNVGAYPETEHGLIDMAGNVRELCYDGWQKNAYRDRVDGAVNPVVMPETTSDRALRGDCFDSFGVLPAASRSWCESTERRPYIGFRPCLIDKKPLLG